MTEQSEFDAATFRRATEDDQNTLEGFECSRGADFEDVVQMYIRRRALPRALAESTFRLFIVLEVERLIAVAGYHPEMLLAQTDKSDTFRGTRATRLHVMALSVLDQSRRIQGSRLSELVLGTLIHEAMEGRSEALLTGIVHRDNVRSLAMCARNGLTAQVRHDLDHVRVSGWFTLEGATG